jgi:hypothetical protein
MALVPYRDRDDTVSCSRVFQKFFHRDAPSLDRRSFWRWPLRRLRIA